LCSEVERLVAPHQSSLDILTSWLFSHSISPSSLSPASPAGDWVQLTVPLSTASELLSATYRTYKHTDSGELVVRTLEYSLPRALHEHVDLVMPTTVFGRTGVGRGMRSMVHVNSRAGGATETETTDAPDVTGPAGQTIAASCNTTITPSCLMQLYRTEGYVPQAADKGNRIGITGYLEQVRYTVVLAYPSCLGADSSI
jgi:tripeptidyl-peptidase-1